MIGTLPMECHVATQSRDSPSATSLFICLPSPPAVDQNVVNYYLVCNDTCQPNPYSQVRRHLLHYQSIPSLHSFHSSSPSSFPTSPPSLPCIHHKDSLTYRPSSQGWAPRVLPFLFYLLFIIACLLMFVYVWVGLGFFLSLLTSS